MEVQSFSSLNIKIGEENEVFVGKKKDMEDVIDQPIVILDYKVKPSIYADKYDRCLHLQIEMDGKKCVVFSGSKYLIMQIEQVAKEQLPLSTVIKKQQNRSLIFT